jgi:perosamine synthetase
VYVKSDQLAGATLSYEINQVDLFVDDDELRAIAPSIAAHWLTEGPNAAAFQDRLRELTGAKHVFFAPNGTLGLFLAALALEAKPGDEMLIPSFTFYGSAAAAHFAGFKPVFVDCDPETFNATPDAFANAIGPKTRAIMPVHIYGQACDMEGIMAVARGKNIAVLEDAAQALSVKFNGKAAGTFGDIGVYSLFSDKVITTGEGGVVVTQSDELAGHIKLLRNQGRPNSGTFVHPSLGMNFRITDIQAAIGLSQLKKLPLILADRQKKWRRYEEGLRGVGDVRPMRVIPGSTLTPFRFPFVTSDRERLAASLEAAGVQTRGFFHPMHLQPKFQVDGQKPLPVSEALGRTGICLPIHHHITDANIDKMIDVVRRHFRG